MAIKRKPHVQPMASTWWKKLPSYHFYMLREGTVVLAVWLSIELVFGLLTLKNSPETWAGFVGLLQNPVTVIINLITLVAALLHTKIRFGLVPEAANIIVKGGKVRPEPTIKSLWAVTVATIIVILFVALYW